MAEEENYTEFLDLSSLDIRVRNVLRRLGVDTVEKLLALTEAELSVLKNCGRRTIAKIKMLQQEYGKQLPSVKDKQHEVYKALDNSRGYFNGLIAVVIAANDLIQSTDKSSRYYIPVSKRRFNTLSRFLQELRKQQK